MTQGLTLSQLNRRVAQALNASPLQNVWVIAELSDLRVSHGHCYMELMEKDARTGSVNARLRAVIWASTYPRLNAEFFAATGQRLVSGLKVMVCGSVNFHSAFGMSFVISAIDPSFTMGEAERRRREILERLTREGVVNDNRTLEWPIVAHNIAVISAAGAAGYGDFINQLYTNPARIRFHSELFTAILQGDRTAPSVIASLNQIHERIDEFDCVVIIRGGGATSDLLAFDDYNLAYNIAQFPIPVIVGIGHERDTTVLDYVANMRVKTPTAAAEWLIARGEAALEGLRRIGSEIMLTVNDIISEARKHLAYTESTLALAPSTAIERGAARLQRFSMSLAETGARRIAPELTRLSGVEAALSSATANRISRESDRLKSRAEMIEVLSPQATLRRGYSITTINGKAIRNTDELQPGIEVTTTVANGSFNSIVK